MPRKPGKTALSLDMLGLQTICVSAPRTSQGVSPKL